MCFINICAARLPASHKPTGQFSQTLRGLIRHSEIKMHSYSIPPYLHIQVICIDILTLLFCKKKNNSSLMNKINVLEMQNLYRASHDRNISPPKKAYHDKVTADCFKALRTMDDAV